MMIDMDVTQDRIPAIRLPMQLTLPSPLPEEDDEDPMLYAGDPRFLKVFLRFLVVTSLLAVAIFMMLAAVNHP
jgi:hypothetical protein